MGHISQTYHIHLIIKNFLQGLGEAKCLRNFCEKLFIFITFYRNQFRSQEYAQRDHVLPIRITDCGIVLFML